MLDCSLCECMEKLVSDRWLKLHIFTHLPRTSNLEQEDVVSNPIVFMSFSEKLYVQCEMPEDVAVCKLWMLCILYIVEKLEGSDSMYQLQMQ